MADSPDRKPLIWIAFVIVSVLILPYLLVLIALAIVFSICDAQHVSIGNFDADKLVSNLGYFWRPLPAQYEAIKFSSGQLSAENYAVFYLLISGIYVLLLLHAAYYYYSLNKRYELPNVGNRPDWIVCAIALIAAVPFVFRDYPGSPGAFGFRADPRGFHYFRQVFLAMAAIIGPMMLTVFAMRLIGRFTSRRDPRQ